MVHLKAVIFEPLPNPIHEPKTSSDNPDVVTVRVPATSANLGPGFDALGLALSLWNEITLNVAPADTSLVSGEGADLLPAQGATIAHRAAHQVFAQLEISLAGLALELRNHIPLARGLGSSSAAIVGGLVAANEWARRKHDRALNSRQLLDLATKIEGHPDNVAPALLGGLVVAATNEDGQVSHIRLPASQFPRFCVWIPDSHLETKAARAALPATYSRADAVWNLSRAALLVAALASHDFSVLGEALRDRIHQDYRAPLVPGWDVLTDAAHAAGAMGVTLSGAGPTILAWCASEEAAINVGDNWKSLAAGSNLSGRALPLRAVEDGAQVIAA